jgi:hypothetical protein
VVASPGNRARRTNETRNHSIWNRRSHCFRRWAGVPAGADAASAAGRRRRGPPRPTRTPPFKKEELEALLAPVALYPDALLAQIFMASTYPLEIVEAARWSKEHPDVKGDAVAGAVQSQTWDPSVKSLVAVPSVLEKMNEKIDWTQKLGDAFLAQQKDVMQAVQVLRTRPRKRQSQEHKEVTVKEEAGAGRFTRASDHHHRIAQSGSGLRAHVQPHRGVRRLGVSHATRPTPITHRVRIRRGVLVVHRGRESSVAPSGATATGVATTSTSTSTARKIQPQRDQPETNRNNSQQQHRGNNNRAGNTANKRQPAELSHNAKHRKAWGYRDQSTQQKYNRRGNQQMSQRARQYRATPTRAVSRCSVRA